MHLDRVFSFLMLPNLEASSLVRQTVLKFLLPQANKPSRLVRLQKLPY